MNRIKRNVDAKTLEEIVRCGDCSNGKPYGDKQQWRQCKLMAGLMENHEFCSMGEGPDTKEREP